MRIFGPRENSNGKEGKTDSSPVDKYYFSWTKKALDITLNLNVSRSLMDRISKRPHIRPTAIKFAKYLAKAGYLILTS